MADKIVLVDTSILIDLFRKTDKTKSKLVDHVRQGYIFCISAITEYEIYAGATVGQYEFWDNFLFEVNVIPFDQAVVSKPVYINNKLKQISKQIDLPDLFIAATAVTYGLPFATLNRKHFDRIEDLNSIA